MTLKPSGIDTSAPQLKHLRLAIQQNSKAGSRASLTYSNPQVARWFYEIQKPTENAAVSGQEYKVSKQLFVVNSIQTQDFNDSGDDAAQPFYNFVTAQLGNDAPSPLESKGVTSNTISDSPQIPHGNESNFLKEPTTGRYICEVAYSQLAAASITNSFDDWAVIANYDTNGVTLLSSETLAKTSWSVRVRSEGDNNRATGGESAAATTRGLDGVNANQNQERVYEFDKESGFDIMVAP